MSRAFVKESEGPSEVDLRLAAALSPADREDVTREGFETLRMRLAEAADSVQRAELERKLAAVRVVDPPPDRNVVAFGATVVVEDELHQTTSYRLVGASEIDVMQNAVGVQSPLAVALLGACAGNSIVWRRPAGDRRLTVVSVTYPSGPA